MAKSANERRVALVGAVRTPFARSGHVFRELRPLGLGKLLIAELVQGRGLPSREVEQVVCGRGAPSDLAENWARDLVMGTGLSPATDAFDVSRPGLGGYQAVVSLAQSIATKVCDCGIALAVNRSLATSATTSARLREAFDHLDAGHLLAKTATPLRLAASALAADRAAEAVARRYGVSREEQEKFASRSHDLAALAWRDGRLREQVMRVFVPPTYEVFDEDDGPRARPETQALEHRDFALPARYVPSACAEPADGASSLLLMSEKKARRLGAPVLGYVKSYAFSGLDPAAGQSLLAPAHAIDRALARAGLKLKHMALIDVDEASAAQVLGDVRALDSEEFARKELARDKRVGNVDEAKLNVTGGSLAFGNADGATGIRQLSQTLFELARRGGEFALCAAGTSAGHAAALVLEAE